jgi:hypothetical protein
MTEYGEGFGRPYVKDVPSEVTTENGRRERFIVTVADGHRITVVLRDTIVCWDPFLVLVKASAFPFIVSNQNQGRPYFPAPLTNRKTKDALIKTDVRI